MCLFTRKGFLFWEQACFVGFIVRFDRTHTEEEEGRAGFCFKFVCKIWVARSRRRIIDKMCLCVSLPLASFRRRLLIHTRLFLEVLLLTRTHILVCISLIRASLPAEFSDWSTTRRFVLLLILVAKRSKRSRFCRDNPLKLLLVRGILKLGFAQVDLKTWRIWPSSNSSRKHSTDR